MNDRQRMIEVLKCAHRELMHCTDERRFYPTTFRADALIAAGFGDVAEKDKRIAVLEREVERLRPLKLDDYVYFYSKKNGELKCGVVYRIIWSKQHDCHRYVLDEGNYSYGYFKEQLFMSEWEAETAKKVELQNRQAEKELAEKSPCNTFELVPVIPTFAEDEKVFVKICTMNFYVRDKDGGLWGFEHKPHKEYEYWDSVGECINVSRFTNLQFDAIKWTDDNPWSRKEILKS